MNRPIRFRGKTQQGEWVYGFYVGQHYHGDDRHYLLSDKVFVPVLPETVGQSTGEKDTDHQNIFEDDVVSILGFGNVVMKYPFVELFESLQDRLARHLLGNIHDNKELLNK